MSFFRPVIVCVALAIAVLGIAAHSFAEAAKPAPLKALLIAGGCCHDYAVQKDLLKKGLEERANVVVDIVFEADKSTNPPLPIYGNPDYAKGYDVVIHDECAADMKDTAVVEGVLAPHKAGIPAVNLHCAMHSYRTSADVKQPAEAGTADALWFDFLGIQSSGHGPKKPLAIAFEKTDHPAIVGCADWTTRNEELYNNIVVRDGVTVLARGTQEPNDKPGFTDAVVVWTNLYGEKKTRVFSTTLGHYNETVADPRYLDLVTQGLLWACGQE